MIPHNQYEIYILINSPCVLCKPKYFILSTLPISLQEQSINALEFRYA